LFLPFLPFSSIFLHFPSFSFIFLLYIQSLSIYVEASDLRRPFWCEILGLGPILWMTRTLSHWRLWCVGPWVDWPINVGLPE
jgi:hypothetical protein